jgi:release factor glutamine methyltransferase
MDPSCVYPVEADTILLCEEAVAEVRPGDRVLDMGTGSGYIAARLREKSSLLIATDCNPHAVQMAHGQGIDVILTDLAAALRGPFDLILFNPPYLPTSPGERIDDPLEAALDGGPDGRSVIARFAATVGEVLAPGGRILLLISSLTGPEEVIDLFRKVGYASSIVRRIRVFDEDLMVLQIVRIPEDSHAVQL